MTKRFRTHKLDSKEIDQYTHDLIHQMVQTFEKIKAIEPDINFTSYFTSVFLNLTAQGCDTIEEFIEMTKMIYENSSVFYMTWKQHLKDF